MLIMKKGMPANSGKTTEALKKVVELLSNNQSVLYINNELSFGSVRKRLEELTDDCKLFNEFYFCSSEGLEELISDIQSDDVLKDTSIIIDIGKDVSDLKCEQDLYVYYQTPRELR